MKIQKLTSGLVKDEREVLLHYDEVGGQWIMDTTILKFYNKAKKQGWNQVAEYIYEDGTVCGGIFEAPKRSVTIRNVEKKQLSDKQLTNLLKDDDEE